MMTKRSDTFKVFGHQKHLSVQYKVSLKAEAI